MSTLAIDPDRKLGELVAERPARARVLERAGIDYCCHGRRTLEEACRSADVDLDQVVTELDAVAETAGAEVDQLPPVALIEHIVATHHRYLDEELPLLVALATKVRDVHGERHPELAEVARLVEAATDDLVPHLAKEERVLFPAIGLMVEGQRDFPFGVIGNPIHMMLTEHEVVGALLGELRAVTGDYAVPDDGCASYRSLYARLEELETDTFRHIHLENNVLFPAVAALAEG